MTSVADAFCAIPAPRLRPLVERYSGIRYQGFAPGTHLGLPSRHLTVAVSLGAPLTVAIPDRSRAPRTFTALAAGLHTGPAIIPHGGSQHSISLELTPLGARALLRVPAAELAGTVERLLSLVSADELEELRQQSEAELQEPGRGTTFTPLQCWRRCPA
jgi:hypothetical protein